MFSADTGLLAAFFLSVSFLHVRDSHFAMLDIPFTFFCVVFYLCIWGVYLNGSWRSYLLTGFVGGIATAFKYFGIVLIIPLFIAGIIASPRSPGNFLTRAFSIKFITTLILFCLVLAITSPYIILDFSSFILDIKEEILLSQYKSGHTLLPQLRTARGWLYHLAFSLRYGMGLLPELICISGVLWSVYRSFKGERQHLLLLSFIVPFYLLLSPQKKPFMRYVTVMLPFLYLSGSRIITDNLSRIGGLKGKIILLLIALAVIAEPLHNLYLHDKLLGRKDSRNLASRWMEKNIPQTAFIILSNPLIFGNPPVFNKYYHRISLSGEETPEDLERLSYLLRSRQAYLIVNDHFLLYSSVNQDAISYLIQLGDLVYSIEAFESSNACRPIYDPFDAYYLPLASYRGVKHAGPNIRIYRFPRSPNS